MLLIPHDASSIGACRPRIFFINGFLCSLEDEWQRNGEGRETLLGTEDDGWVTGNNAYAHIPSLLPRIRTVLWLIIMEIEGHHSQWYTHFSSLSISPCPSLYFIADRKNNKCLKKEQMLKRLSWSYIYYNLCHGSTLFQPKTPYRQKREIFFFFFFFSLFW